METNFNADGYMSAVLGHRMGELKNGTLAVSAHMLYNRGGVYARIVDLPAERALARGLEIEGDADDLISNELDRLDAAAAFTEALRWSVLDGGGAVIMITDQGTLEDALLPGALNQILELRPVSALDVTPSDSTYADPSQPKFGQPIWYNVKPEKGATYRVHETRLLPVSGATAAGNNGGSRVPFQGRSEVDRAYMAMIQLDGVMTKALQIMERKQQAVYGMTGMAKSLDAGSRANGQNPAELVVQKRINFVDSARGVLNTVAVDAEDKYEIRDLSLSGIKDVVGEFQVGVSAEAGIPATLLFGRSPAGMNATGESDFRGYNERVEGLQSRRLRPPLERLLSLVVVQRSLQGKKPDNWKLVFPPLSELTQKEQAEIDEIESKTVLNELKSLESALGASIVSQEEAVEWLRERGLFGLENEIDASSASRNVSYAQST